MPARVSAVKYRILRRLLLAAHAVTFVLCVFMLSIPFLERHEYLAYFEVVREPEKGIRKGSIFMILSSVCGLLQPLSFLLIQVVYPRLRQRQWTARQERLWHEKQQQDWERLLQEPGADGTPLAEMEGSQQGLINLMHTSLHTNDENASHPQLGRILTAVKEMRPSSTGTATNHTDGDMQPAVCLPSLKGHCLHRGDTLPSATASRTAPLARSPLRISSPSLPPLFPHRRSSDITATFSVSSRAVSAPTTCTTAEVRPAMPTMAPLTKADMGSGGDGPAKTCLRCIPQANSGEAKAAATTSPFNSPSGILPEPGTSTTRPASTASGEGVGTVQHDTDTRGTHAGGGTSLPDITAKHFYSSTSSVPVSPMLCENTKAMVDLAATAVSCDSSSWHSGCTRAPADSERAFPVSATTGGADVAGASSFPETSAGHNAVPVSSTDIPHAPAANGVGSLALAQPIPVRCLESIEGDETELVQRIYSDAESGDLARRKITTTSALFPTSEASPSCSYSTGAAQALVSKDRTTETKFFRRILMPLRRWTWSFGARKQTSCRLSDNCGEPFRGTVCTDVEEMPEVQLTPPPPPEQQFSPALALDLTRHPPVLSPAILHAKFRSDGVFRFLLTVNYSLAMASILLMYFFGIIWMVINQIDSLNTLLSMEDGWNTMFMYRRVSAATDTALCMVQLKGKCSGGTYLCNASTYTNASTAHSALCPYCSDEQQQVIQTFVQTCPVRYEPGKRYFVCFFAMLALTVISSLVSFSVSVWTCSANVLLTVGHVAPPLEGVEALMVQRGIAADSWPMPPDGGLPSASLPESSRASIPLHRSRATDDSSAPMPLAPPRERCARPFHGLRTPNAVLHPPLSATMTDFLEVDSEAVLMVDKVAIDAQTFSS